MKQAADGSDFHILCRGALYAVIASSIGSVVFAVMPLVPLLLTFQAPRRFDNRYLGSETAFLAFVLVILTAVPAMVGGAVLAAMLKKDFRNDRLSGRRALMKGVIVGVASLSVVVILIVRFYELQWLIGMIWYFAPRDLQGFLFFSGAALLIAAIAGGVVGNRLAAYLRNSV
jgi:hypothetical protein